MFTRNSMVISEELGCASERSGGEMLPQVPRGDGSWGGLSTRLGCLWKLLHLQYASHHGLFVLSQDPVAHPSLRMRVPLSDA